MDKLVYLVSNSSEEGATLTSFRVNVGSNQGVNSAEGPVGWDVEYGFDFTRFFVNTGVPIAPTGEASFSLTGGIPQMALIPVTAMSPYNGQFDPIPNQWAPVPEPGTAALVGLGLLTLLTRCGRRIKSG